MLLDRHLVIRPRFTPGAIAQMPKINLPKVYLSTIIEPNGPAGGCVNIYPDKVVRTRLNK